MVIFNYVSRETSEVKMKKLLAVIALSILVGGCTVATTMPDPYQKTLRFQTDYRQGYNDGHALRFNNDSKIISRESYADGFRDGHRDRRADTYMNRYDYRKYNKEIPNLKMYK